MPDVAPIYIFDPADKPSLPVFEVPLVEATDVSVEGYGRLVDDPDECEIEITRWPAQGWRSVDPDTGDQGGTVEGIFQGEWRGDLLFGSNEAVGGNYVLGFTTDPQKASSEAQTVERTHVHLWHFNYHPDGGQLFFPLDKKPFVVPVALPGDDLTPEKVIGLWCDGSRGLYIHPSIWHEGIFPVDNNQRFLDRQGAVHARVSCDFGKEFGVYVAVPLSWDAPK